MIYFVGLLYDKVEANNMTPEERVELSAFLSAFVFIFYVLDRLKIMGSDTNYIFCKSNRVKYLLKILTKLNQAVSSETERIFVI